MKTFCSIVYAVYWRGFLFARCSSYILVHFIVSIVVSLVADYYYDQLGLCDYGSILSKKDS